MLKIFVLLACSLCRVCAAADYSIVFVHIGESIPVYAHIAVAQARAFNPNCPIIFIASSQAIEGKEKKPSKRRPVRQLAADITYIPYESLTKTAEHLRFEKEAVLDAQYRGGLWRYANERFLYLHDFMQQYACANVFHMEYDNMLYVNLEELLPIFCAHYPGIAAIFDNDERCIPGFVFIAHPQAMRALASCFAECASKHISDMYVMAKFRAESQERWLDPLPIIPKEYADTHPLIAANGLIARHQEKYYQHIEQFQSLFDGAAIGQYLGGVDPRNQKSKPGYINESCVFNPAHFQFVWHKDAQGREVPYAVFRDREYRINNLHIHSKVLIPFKSLRDLL